jgi:hypothetical protein
MQGDGREAKPPAQSSLSQHLQHSADAATAGRVAKSETRMLAFGAI